MEKELKYRHLFENMLDGFAYCKMIFDIRGKPIDFIYLQINDAFSKLTGLKKSKIIGKKVTEAIPEIKQEHPELFEIYGRVASTGKPEKFELFFKPLNTWLYLSVYSPMKGYFAVVFENITERKNVEASLKSSAERFTSLANSLPEIVFETDLTGKIIYANQPAFELSSYSHENNKDTFIFDFFAPKSRERAKIDFAHAMQTSASINNEYALLKKDGGEFYGIVKGVPIEFNGKAVGMRGLAIDITEQEKASETFVFQSQLLEAVGQALIATDKNGIIRYWNKEAKKLFGWAAEDVLGKSIDEFLSADFSQDQMNKISLRLISGESWTSENQVKNRFGNIVPIIVSRNPIFNKGGDFFGSINVYTDISDQKSMEIELKGYVEEYALAVEKINELNEKLRVIASLTRHDVRNKLGVLTGYMYMLRKKVADNEVAIKYLTKMDEATKQLLAILEFERIYEQIGSEELAYVNVGKFFDEASALVSDFKGINLKCECDGLEVLTDSLLRQLLYNLMDNTLKYGEKTTLIRLYCKKDENFIQLIYEDNGAGMTDEVRSHLFEKGFGKGTGFGLYMIKRIIETYGWSIEENGELGVCARFTMKIPENKFKFEN